MQIKKKIWTAQDLTNLNKFIISQHQSLIKNFYMNIIENKLKHRKAFQFFNMMSRYVERTITECKSKFQKHERIIYKDYLEIPEEHFELFLFLRKKKKLLNCKKKNIRANFMIPFDEIIRKSKLQKSIIKLILSKDIKSFIDDETLSKIH